MRLIWSYMDIIKALTINLMSAYLFTTLDKRLGLLHNQRHLQG